MSYNGTVYNYIHIFDGKECYQSSILDLVIYYLFFCAWLYYRTLPHQFSEDGRQNNLFLKTETLELNSAYVRYQRVSHTHMHM